MVTKKTSPKHKRHFSSRNIILFLVLLATLLIATVALIQSTQNKDSERKESEQFKVAETDINTLQTQLNMSAGSGEWSLDKQCDKGACRFNVKPIEPDANPYLTDLKSSITKAGNITSEEPKKDSDKNYIGFKLMKSKNECETYFVKNKDQTATQVEISCVVKQ